MLDRAGGGRDCICIQPGERLRVVKQASPPAAKLAKPLAGWFRQHARKLTWRGTRDPYAIWVSEVMLQQTRVETVEKYFSNFIARFPTFKALAQATQDEVLAMWSGLGYYRRARLLHRGAQYLVERGATQLPSEVAELRAIPGVGPYTAGAIASIAFDRPAALVDGNVARVSSRIRAVKDPAKQGATAKEHWTWVQAVLEAGRPRELAQAVMELGATVCTPKNPACDACPLQAHCKAHAQDLQTQIPAPKKKAASKAQSFVALAMVDAQGRLLFEQRGMEQLLAGMWCLPLLELSSEDTAVQEPASWIAQYKKQWPRSLCEAGRWSVSALPAQEAVTHIFTHRRWTLKVLPARFEGQWSRVLRSRPGWQGVGPQDGGLSSLGGGVPTVTRKLLAALEKLEAPKQSELVFPELP